MLMMNCRYELIHLAMNNNNNNIIIIIIIIVVVSCHRPFFPGTSLEPAVIPTAQASSFTLQYFIIIITVFYRDVEKLGR
jgi:ABC-type polysaccharide/polyol phosphate export permease